MSPRLFFLLLLASSLLAACPEPTPRPTDDDDDSGSDDDDSGADDDDSSDDDDATPDPDWDGDGLPNEFEDEIGSDPTNVDTDGDGFEDGVEWNSYYLPTDASDFPYIGGYPRGPFDEDYEGGGYDPGQLSSTWSHLDQHGQELHLHRFLGNVVLIYIDYEDAPGLGHISPQVQEAYDTYRDQGFVVLNFLTHGFWDFNGYGAPFAQRYIDAHGLTFPVFEHGTPQPISNNYHYAPFFPHWTVLDRHLRIRTPSLSGYTEWPLVLADIETYLAEVGPEIDWPIQE
jgi:hypothetical protein